MYNKGGNSWGGWGAMAPHLLANIKKFNTFSCTYHQNDVEKQNMSIHYSNDFNVQCDSAYLYNTLWPRIFRPHHIWILDFVLEYSRPHVFWVFRKLTSAEWILAKRQASCLFFVIAHIRDKGSLRRRLMMKTKNQMTLIAKMYMLKISQKNLNICSDQQLFDFTQLTMTLQQIDKLEHYTVSKVWQTQANHCHLMRSHDIEDNTILYKVHSLHRSSLLRRNDSYLLVRITQSYGWLFFPSRESKCLAWIWFRYLNSRRNGLICIRNISLGNTTGLVEAEYGQHLLGCRGREPSLDGKQ